MARAHNSLAPEAGITRPSCKPAIHSSTIISRRYATLVPRPVRDTIRERNIDDPTPIMLAGARRMSSLELWFLPLHPLLWVLVQRFQCEVQFTRANALCRVICLLHESHALASRKYEAQLP